ncbi:hypothetical protein [Pedobacter nutrimenti]|uniref:ACP phosphodiesterase n=1 Tax=Pedobacter nutrimenti TaxID=1241337 RepID=UPI00292F517F|nr:hypothetical protein [Pedobacter nutrimenti]
MNFLSHYYFERHNPDHNIVIGVVLPDFVKNAHKDWNLNPQKEAHLFSDDLAHESLLCGWERHLEVDKLFHSSDFFITRTATLKQLLLPSLQSGPVKPFFLAHIGLELMLDHLLTIEGRININRFYEQLQQANTHELQSFLTLAGIKDLDHFLRFLNNFISSRYLLSYQKIENITYALNRICMRLWENPFQKEQLEQVTKSLLLFRDQLQKDYLSIFKEIESKL